MTKKEQILTNQDALLDAMLNKNENTLRNLIHENASVFGSAIHEFEKGLENVLRYYMEALALLPDDKKVNIKTRHYTDLKDHALVEQEFDIHFTLEGNDIKLLTLRQSALWTYQPERNGKPSNWRLLHDHTSMPDHLGAFETISSSELLEGNMNLEFEVEKIKGNLNRAVADLKIAQNQLVQNDRLSSIGQLAAGIAHEIKNPLNFVNNFSEVILELIEEIRTELERLSAHRNKPLPNNALDEIYDLINDIDANLNKIVEHGKRANSIVKSMLLHSRGKSETPEPTDINALIDEYLKLAYHAMRASDSSFNVDIQTSYDEKLPPLDIVPQDISRAFLNIINNAMYAADQFARSKSDRKPVVSISTSLSKDLAEIKIWDNGPGIPPEHRDKIFQPFFTTKPSGAGTGLGLPMTYDIVKKHLGSMDVQSEAGKFTEFIITLPLKNRATQL